MIIENSNIQMSAEHEKSRTITSTETRGINIPQFDGSDGSEESSSLPRNAWLSIFNSISSTEEERYQSQVTAGLDTFLNAQTEVASKTDSYEASSMYTKTTMALFDRLMEALTGKQSTDINTEPVDTEPVSTDASSAQPSDSLVTNGSSFSALGLQALDLSSMKAFGPGITINLKSTETIEEYECSKFSACGTVQTADGETIDLNLNLEMSRSYSRTTEVVQEIAFKDPLIINFDGNAADLTEETYEFDIDADGELDVIHFLSANSSMLALDKNDDGIINDGTELFGAISGDGFADLATYDDDGNGWIDEADSIFDDLLLWSKVDGEDQLNSLTDGGVGAIYLNAIDTSFDLHNDDNEVRGQVKQSGIYLTDSGQSGVVQQIDLAV